MDIDEKIVRFIAGQPLAPHLDLVKRMDAGIDALLHVELGGFVERHPEYTDEQRLELRSDMAEMFARQAAAAMLSSFGRGAVPPDRLLEASRRLATEYVGDLARELLEIVRELGQGRHRS